MTPGEKRWMYRALTGLVPDLLLSIGLEAGLISSHHDFILPIWIGAEAVSAAALSIILFITCTNVSRWCVDRIQLYQRMSFAKSSVSCEVCDSGLEEQEIELLFSAPSTDLTASSAPGIGRKNGLRGGLRSRTVSTVETDSCG